MKGEILLSKSKTDLSKPCESEQVKINSFLSLLIGCIFFCGSFFSVIISRAQENIPLGTWREHLSFTSVKQVVSGGSSILAASDNGLLKYDQEDQSFQTYSTLNVLSSSGISSMAFDSQRKQWIIGYTNGNIDLIQQTAAINYSRLVNPSDIIVSPVIKSILVNESIAYFCTDYGVVVFDLQRNEVKETWRNLGNSGQLLSITKAVIKKDSIYLATASGVLAGNLSDNLLDFNHWKRFSSGDFNGAISSMAVFNSSVYATVDGKGLYRYSGSSWQLVTALSTVKYSFLKGFSEVLAIGGDNKLWSMNSAGLVTPVQDALINSVQDATFEKGKWWIADAQSGLVSNASGAWIKYKSNGPEVSTAFRLKNFNSSIFAVHGEYASDYSLRDKGAIVSKFTDGIWSGFTTQLYGLTDIEEANQSGAYFLGSFGGGLERRSGEGVSTIFNASNSPLQKAGVSDNTVFVTDILKVSADLWVANYNSSKSLHRLKQDDTWESFSFAGSAARYPIRMASDFSNTIWILLADTGGGGVLVVKKDGTLLKYLTDQPGSGLLPDKKVYSMAVDKDGYVWIGTAKGISYFISPKEDGIRPIVEGRYLLTDEKVTAIAVDAGNRKWIGTERGLWLFNPTGEKTIYSFNTTNSPLPSNTIKDIAIHGSTGEVFISTDKGLISFRADATNVDDENIAVKIFPNPVTGNFNGMVGISGLYENALVKITDASGKLVNQMYANGGTASWNVLDYSGKRVSSGVYLVIASSEDGGESVAGKIVVVE